MIAVDWGSSSLRAYRLDADGGVIEQRAAIAACCPATGNFADDLASQIDGWDDTHIMLCGMIGSRGGWVEVPYVDCPAGEREIAAAIVPARNADTAASPAVTCRIAPGMIDRTSSPVADVMRGEETQIVGLLDLLGEGTHTICLPGTHSKWVTVRDGAIALDPHRDDRRDLRAVPRTQRAGTADDGGRTASSTPRPSMKACARSGATGGLLHHLFGVRTLGLLGRLSDVQSPSYLSGLLIGHEVREQASLSSQVHLIGNDRLQAAYTHALKAFGVEVHRHSETLAANGLHRLAQVMA